MLFDPAIEEMYTRILAGDKIHLARAITWVESHNDSIRQKALQLLEKCSLISPSSLRIAVTGSPGVGKSTLIEALGMQLIDQGYRVAVLAVDPTSTESLGSILGDKTRMNELSSHQNAFVRPSPTGLELGGVNSSTRESILLCETAGFNIIFIETVGVGQSEVEVKTMCDLFMLLMNPGGGDDLQGIKKGIVELADIIAITKSDGTLKDASQSAFNYIKQSLQVIKHSSNQIEPQVIKVSALEDFQIDKLTQLLFKMNAEAMESGKFDINRKEQLNRWFELGFYKKINEWIRQNEEVVKIISDFRNLSNTNAVFVPIEIEKQLQKLKTGFNLK